jgi:hypothetical protein
MTAAAAAAAALPWVAASLAPVRQHGVEGPIVWDVDGGDDVGCNTQTTPKVRDNARDKQSTLRLFTSNFYQINISPE